MADPLLHSDARARLAGASAVVLVHLLPVAMLSRCDESVQMEPASPPPLHVTLHDRPAREIAGAGFEIQPVMPRLEFTPVDLVMEAEPAPIPEPVVPQTSASSPGPAAAPSASTSPRVASARDCWPYRWLLRMSRTIDSALKYPAEARLRGERGTAFVRVSVERSGQVLESPLIRSSGHSRLDGEARAVIQRVGRFQPMEPGDCIGYDVIVVDQPVRFAR